MKKEQLTVYLSGPITGAKDYGEKFLRAECEMRSRGWKVINPATASGALPPLTHAEYMSICERALGIADAVLMLDGWEGSKGARMEHDWAEKADMVIMYEYQPPAYAIGVMVGKKLRTIPKEKPLPDSFIGRLRRTIWGGKSRDE